MILRPCKSSMRPHSWNWPGPRRRESTMAISSQSLGPPIGPTSSPRAARARCGAGPLGTGRATKISQYQGTLSWISLLCPAAARYLRRLQVRPGASLALTARCSGKRSACWRICAAGVNCEYPSMAAGFDSGTSMETRTPVSSNWLSGNLGQDDPSLPSARTTAPGSHHRAMEGTECAPRSMAKRSS